MVGLLILKQPFQDRPTRPTKDSQPYLKIQDPYPSHLLDSFLEIARIKRGFFCVFLVGPLSKSEIA